MRHTTSAGRRNVAAMNAASKPELDAYAMRVFGVSWDSADYLAKLGARLTRGESISREDRNTIVSIYPHVDSREVDRIVKFINDQPPGPNRVFSYTAHLSGTVDGEMRERLQRVVASYATHEISQGILAKREANAPRDAEGRPYKPTPPPKEDPTSTRSILERLVKKDERQAADALRSDPDSAREILANRAELAVDRLDANAAGVMPLNLRETISAATDFHSTMDVAADEGLVELDRDGS